MDNYLKSSNSNRYVIEDSIPKVTSDGEPHEVMTMVAMLSGLIAAAIVLFVLVMLIGSRQQRTSSRLQTQENDGDKMKGAGGNIIPLFVKNNVNGKDNSPILVSVSTISAAIDAVDQERSVALTSETVLNAVSLSGITTVRC